MKKAAGTDNENVLAKETADANKAIKDIEKTIADLKQNIKDLRSQLNESSNESNIYIGESVADKFRYLMTKNIK